MNWQEVCAHPALQDLPFKIELDRYGKIIMSPVKIFHARLQGKLEKLLSTLKRDGESFPECAIKTAEGTKVADVVWVSEERLATIKNESECPIAPEICIEILSGSNSEKEMAEKMHLYFQSGAEEVWLCDEEGQMRFFNARGQLAQSKMVAGFPQKILL